MPITTRDQIWAAALALRGAVEDDDRRADLELTDQYGIPGFTVEDVCEHADADLSARTVRDTLNAMHDLGELAKRDSRPSRYRAADHASDDDARAAVASTASATDGRSSAGVTAGAESDSSAAQSDGVNFEDVDLPGSGGTLEQRREAVRELYDYLRHEGQATASEMRDLVWAKTGYASARSAWKNCLYDGLKQVAEQDDALHVPGEGQHQWRYADE